MVVLQEDHVEKTDTVVHTASEYYSLFLQIAQTRRRLTGVEHVATGVLDEGLILMRGGRYAGHALHDIEHRTLDLQETQLFTIDLESHVSGLHMIAVMQELLHTALRIEISDDLFRYLNTG